MNRSFWPRSARKSMTNSKWIWFWTQVRGTFWFCYELVQIFTDFVTWQTAKAYKEWSIQVEKFCHFRRRFSFIIKMIKKLYLQKNTGRTSVFLKTMVIWLFDNTENHSCLWNQFIYVCSCHFNYLAMDSQLYPWFRASHKDWNGSSSLYSSRP